MNNKKILVKMLKDGWKGEGLTDRITIRQAEAWAFMDITNKKQTFEIIDDRIIIKKSYPGYLDYQEIIEIKWKQDFEK